MRIRAHLIGKTRFVITVTALLSLASASFCQSASRALAFQSLSIHASPSDEQIHTSAILPDGHLEFRGATLRSIIATAYTVDLEHVTGGPSWLDDTRFDIEATAPESASQADRLAMLQSLLAQDFRLTLHHDPARAPVYALSVAKAGLALHPVANPVYPVWARASGDPKQLHIACYSESMSGLAELLPEIAPGYIDLPVVDRTGLQGVYDFQLDWMGRGAYDAATQDAAAGKPKDPLAVSMFDAVGRLGLSLEKTEDVKDAIVVDSAADVSHASSAAAATSASDLDLEKLQAIDRFVADEMGREHIPGLQVGVYSRGRILLAKGYGLANVELNVPVKPETIFQSGSVGKQFVSAAIMMLVEQGKVGLDDSIVKYFPDAPESWKPVRIKNLLSHTSGLGEYESGDRIGPAGPFYLRLDFSENELVHKIEALPIDFAPGEKWSYRNTNYVLLGAVIHKVTGMFYADYLEEKIFKPWYMTSTRLISDRDVIPNRSSGYEFSGGRLRNQEWVSPTFNSTADGTLYFNVLDLANWDEALYGTSLLKQSSLDRIWTVFPLNNGSPNPSGYGFGWEIQNLNGHRIIEHGGAWQGFTCDIRRAVDDEVTVVVLTNLAGANPGLFAERISGIVRPSSAPPPPREHKEVAIDPNLLDGYVGKYELAPDFVLTITREGDKLYLQATNQQRFQIFPEGEKDFFLKVVDAQVSFLTDAQGRATELILHQRGDRHAKRIE